MLLGGAAALTGAAAAVDTGLLPGGSPLRRLLHQEVAGLPDVAAGLQVSGSFVSAHRQSRKCGWTIAYPGHHAERLPVVVVLHGRGSSHRSAFGDELGLQRFLVAGGHRFAIASVDGGDTYWHRRASGEDAGAMVTEEFLPLLAARGLNTRQLGLLGWSMGGYGSFWLAGLLGPGKVTAIAAESPAIWHHAGDTAAGAFDDPADFAAHDVFGHPAWVADSAVRIDCGTEDGFCSAARDYAALIRPKPAGGFQAGGHTLAYWRQRAPEQLSFLAQHLT
jgi:enterochelin esterase-like enzyme